MPLLSPGTINVYDICVSALKDAGALGIGQTPLAEDINDAWARLQWMLQQWERKRWLVYDLVTYLVTSTGQNTPYTIGPTGTTGGVPQISVGAFTPVGNAPAASRPNRIESAFFRQLVNVPNGPVDYPLKLVESLEDYNKIALKGLTNFSLTAYYQASWPLGNLFVWPWPQNGIYQVGVAVRDQLPQGFAGTNVSINLPFEYSDAIIANLALRLRPKYGIGTYPGDTVPQRAKDGLATLRSGNFRIANLDMPAGLSRYGLYNIYSDQNY